VVGLLALRADTPRSARRATNEIGRFPGFLRGVIETSKKKFARKKLAWAMLFYFFRNFDEITGRPIEASR
jgi:hypothetical protein